MIARISSPSLITAALIGVLLVALAAAFPAPAHADDLIEAEPAPGEIIGEEPEVILLRFDRDLALEPGAHDVQVRNEDGDRVDDGHAEIAGYSRRTMIVHLEEPVEEGEVAVIYRVRFADSGETVRGGFDFAIEPGVEEEEVGEAVEEPRSAESIVLWTVAVMLAIALFAMLLYYLRVATDNAQSSVEEPSDSQH
jgi:methionine-rich copper-binding protein CopC